MIDYAHIINAASEANEEIGEVIAKGRIIKPYWDCHKAHELYAVLISALNLRNEMDTDKLQRFMDKLQRFINGQEKNQQELDELIGCCDVLCIVCQIQSTLPKYSIFAS